MFTKLDSLLWTDSKYKTLSDDSRLLFIYLFSCNHRNVLGYYFLPIPYAAFDLGWGSERVSKGLGELFEKGFITYNYETNMLLVNNFLKYNALENPNQVKGAIKILETLPTDEIDIEFIELLQGFGDTLSPLLEKLEERFGKGIERVKEGYSKQVEEEVEVEVEVEEEVTKTDDDIDKNNLQDLEAHYQVNLKRNSSSKDLQEMVKAYETYKDIEFIKRTMDKAILKNKDSHGELTIRSFSYFIPVLKDEWKKKQLGGSTDEQNLRGNGGENEEIDWAERAGVISL